MLRLTFLAPGQPDQRKEIKMLIKNALVYNTRKKNFDPGDILIENGKIIHIGKVSVSGGEVFDAEGRRIVPGLVDIHSHGIAGFDFLEVDKLALGAMAKAYAAHGVTSVMPTLASAPLDVFYRAIGEVLSFEPEEGMCGFIGVHLEGRYLNPEKKGAHAPQLLSRLDPNELDAPVFRMCPRLHITAAFELDRDGAFAKKAKSIGATLALGHTNATYALARTAEEYGVTVYTHLYNTMPPLHHREGGAVCAALIGDCAVEIICDGMHISPEMISLTHKVKGEDKVVLVSDSMEATGCADGNYSIAGNPVVVKDGRAVTLSGALAGSTLTLETAVRNYMKFCSISLEEAILAATANPARAVGAADVCGSIEEGRQADLIIVSDGESFDIDRVMAKGVFIK